MAKLGADENSFTTPIVLTLATILLVVTILHSSRNNELFAMMSAIVNHRPFSKRAFDTLYETKAAAFLVTAVDKFAENFFVSGVDTIKELDFDKKFITTDRRIAYAKSYILCLDEHWHHQTLLGVILQDAVDVLRRRATAYDRTVEGTAATNEISWIDFVFGPVAEHVRSLSVQVGDPGLIERNKNIDLTVLIALDIKNPPLATYRDGLRLRAFEQTHHLKESMRDYRDELIKCDHEREFSSENEDGNIKQIAVAADSALVHVLTSLGFSSDVRSDDAQRSILTLVLGRLSTVAFETFAQALTDRVPQAQLCVPASGKKATPDDRNEGQVHRVLVGKRKAQSHKFQVSAEVDSVTPGGHGGDKDDKTFRVVLVCDRESAIRPASELAASADFTSIVDALAATFVCDDAVALQVTYEALVASAEPDSDDFRVVAVEDNLARGIFPYDIKLVCRLRVPDVEHPFLCQVTLVESEIACQSMLCTCYEAMVQSDLECTNRTNKNQPGLKCRRRSRFLDDLRTRRHSWLSNYIQGRLYDSSLPRSFSFSQHSPRTM